MTFSRYTNYIAAGLLAACFLYSVGQVSFRTVRELNPKLVTIRIAHYNLESGIREAIDEIAANYSRSHPNVRVEQVTMPNSLYPVWVTTQLVGGTAPDMVMLAPWNGMGPDKVARYFQPLGEFVSQPNPYNAGTDLAGVPWRDTFIDGLNNYPQYQDGLLDYYGVSIYSGASRVFYNKALLKQITGSDVMPDNFRDFTALCDKVLKTKSVDGHPLVPIAASGDGLGVLVQFFNSQLQKLDLHAIYPATSYSKFAQGANEQFGVSYLLHRWTMQQPEIVSGLDLVHKVGQYMQPGFYQLTRDDATTFFCQGRALMVIGGSYDFGGLTIQSPFEIGIYRLPLPDATDSTYGKYVSGPEFEMGGATGGAIGVAKDTPHLAETIDFLRYLTSQKQNQLFVDRSKWLPAVVGVTIPDSMAGFRPVDKGFSSGVSQNPIPLTYGAESARLTIDNVYLLVRDDGGAASFIKAIEPEYEEALVKDSSQVYTDQNDSACRGDISFAAWHELTKEPAHAEEAERKQAVAFDNVNNADDLPYWQRYQVESLTNHKLHR